MLMHLELMHLSLLAKIRYFVSAKLPAHSVTDIDYMHDSDSA